MNYSTNFELKILFTHLYLQPFSGCRVMKLYIPRLTIKSLLVKTMPCWAAHTLYQLTTFKVMGTPPPPCLLPPLGFHYTCKVMHKVLICYNFFALSISRSQGQITQMLCFILALEEVCWSLAFLYPLGTVNYMHLASRGFFLPWL